MAKIAVSRALQDVLRELLLEAEGIHWRLQDLAQLGVWQDVAPVVGVLKVVLLYVRPQRLHDLQKLSLPQTLHHL